jgi:hypothetical protein
VSAITRNNGVGSGDHYPKGQWFPLAFILNSNFGKISISSTEKYFITRDGGDHWLNRPSPNTTTHVPIPPGVVNSFPAGGRMGDADKCHLLVPHSTCWWISTPPEVRTPET